MIPGGMGNMMKQVQKMQKQMVETQEKINQMTIEATAGGGVVKVVITGKKEVKSLNLAPEVVDPDDIEMLQDLIVTAITEAMQKADKIAEEEMKKVTGGLPKIPGLF